MKRNARKLSALVIGLALLMSMFAVAESGGQEIIDLGGDIVIDGGVGTAGGSVTDDGPQGALEIEMDAGEGLPDGGIDPAGAPDLSLDLGLDLNGAALESNAEALAPVTDAAMLADDAVEVSDWATLSANLGGDAPSGETQDNPTCYKLTGDATAQGKDSGIKVASGRHVVLDLNGHTIDRNLGGTINDGYVIGVWGDLTLKGDGIIQGGNNNYFGGGVMVAEGAAFTMQGGTIRNNRAVWGGGGVYVVKATFTMQGGRISGNKAKDTAGGVYNDGTFNMQGGVIGGDEDVDGNTSDDECGGVFNSGTFTMSGDSRISWNSAGPMWNYGGGVYNMGTFTMQGGTISHSKAFSGAGVYLAEKSTFTMQDGRISNNVGIYGGGGVYVDAGASFTMQGGTISDNTVNKHGGGVLNDTTFIMQGGTICNNTAESGGGVFTNDNVSMLGGTICKNTAKNNGAGVFVNHDTFAMDGGSINENNGEGVFGADNWTKFEMYGGEIKNNTGIGVHLWWDFELSGKVSINGNARDVVLNRNDRKIMLEDDLEIDEPIGVSYESALTRATDFTSGFEQYMDEVDPSAWFKSQQGGCHVAFNEQTKEIMLCADNWDDPVSPVIPDAALLARMTVSGSGKTALRIAWTKVADADGYDVYFARCGRDYSDKPRASVTGSCVRVSGLKARTEYKAYVLAWMKAGGKKVYLGDSPEVHAITGGYDAKRCNAKSVRLNKSSVTLKVGRRVTLKATVKGVKSGKKILAHVPKVRWYSSNVNVATVNSSGRIKATGKGRCTVYAIANNGVRASVKVVVK